MPDWFLENGPYVLLVWVIPGAGLLLFNWGLWGDALSRSGHRGNRPPRCPKCWYDMRGSVPGLTCPECGHDAGVERRLYRHRRGWWRIGMGAGLLMLVVLLGGYALAIVGRWFIETGVYLLGVAVVPLLGSALVGWGLWGDRSKGRPRCPKCWYDMRGTVPRLVCPECGRFVASAHYRQVSAAHGWRWEDSPQRAQSTQRRERT